MSKDEKIREQLSAYLDGELSPAEAQKVEQAIEADPALGEELAELRRLRDLLGQLPTVHAPAELAETILQQAERDSLIVEPPSSESPSRFRWVRYLAIAAVLVLAACIGVVIVSELWSKAARRPPITLAHRGEKPTLASEAAETSGVRAEEKPDATVVAEETKEMAGKDALPAKETALAMRDRKADAPKPAVRGKAKARSGEWFGKKGASVDERREKPAMGAVLASATNIEIYTHDLASAQRSVEHVLTSNSITPIRVSPRADAMVIPKSEGYASRAQNYHVARQSTRQVQYVLYATPAQNVKIQNELKLVRRQQIVSQKSSDTRRTLDRATRYRPPRGRVVARKAGVRESDVAAKPVVGMRMKSAVAGRTRPAEVESDKMARGERPARVLLRSGSSGAVTQSNRAVREAEVQQDADRADVLSGYALQRPQGHAFVGQTSSQQEQRRLGEAADVHGPGSSTTRAARTVQASQPASRPRQSTIQQIAGDLGDMLQQIGLIRMDGQMPPTSQQAGANVQRLQITLNYRLPDTPSAASKARSTVEKAQRKD